MIPTYINYKDLLGIIQELDFEVQHPRAGSWVCSRHGSASSVSWELGREP